MLLLQHEGNFKVDLVANYVAVFDHDVLILDPSALYVPEGLGGPSYALLDGVLKARIRDSADLCHCSNAHIFLSHPLFRMLAHYYYYCLHFAYHLKGEAKHIGSRPLNTPLQRPESPALVAKDRRRGDTHIVGYYAPAADVRARESLACWAGPKPTLSARSAKVHSPALCLRVVGGHDKLPIALHLRA